MAIETGEARPYLPSAIALIGLAIILAITAKMGFEYWAVRRGDIEMAWINAGCELIAFGGLAAAMYGWPKRWPWIITGMTMAVIMSAACGVTAYQRLSEDEHARAVAAARQSEVFEDARDDLDAARAAARSWATDDPRPTCVCPETIASWGGTHVAEAERRERVIEQRRASLAALTPQRTFNWAAFARAVGLEAVKFLGFGAFGGVWFYAWRSRRSKARDTLHSAPANIEPTRAEIDQPEAARTSLPALRPRPRRRSTADADIGEWGRPPRLIT
jgi:hypothetical protein